MWALIYVQIIILFISYIFYHRLKKARTIAQAK